ncbi:MAG: hypothetical protein HN348_00325, partial [Proteobacteria bacterium]|nr:hypothetical protein [Pseudomonadota bacterium]
MSMIKLIPFLFVPAVSWSATTITGGNLGNADWDSSKSPYIIEGDVTVQAGATLNIGKGVEVRFKSSDGQQSGLDHSRIELIVEGTLTVAGTESEPVEFHADSGTSKNTWYGIVVDENATSTVINWSTLEHGQHQIHTSASGDTVQLNNVVSKNASSSAMMVLAGTPVLNNVELALSTYGIQLSESGGIDASNCIIHSNTYYGVYATNNTTAALNFDYCTFVQNDWGIRLYASGSGTKTLEVKNSIIAYNADYGVYSTGTGAIATLTQTNYFSNPDGNHGTSYSGSNQLINPLFVDNASDLRLTENSPSRFFSDVGTDIGALPYVDNPTPGLYGTLWEDRTLTGTNQVSGDLTVPQGVTLTVSPGSTLEFTTTDIMAANADPTKAELRIEGSLVSDGTVDEPILFESSSSGSGKWYGIHLLSGATGSSLSNVEVRESVHGIAHEADELVIYTNLESHTNSSSGMTIRGGSPLLINATIHHNLYGISLSNDGSITASNCIIRHNTYYGVYGSNSSDAAAVFDYCTFVGNDWGLRWNTSGSGNKTLEVKNSIIAYNADYGVYSSGTGAAATLSQTNYFSNPDGNSGVSYSGSNQSINPLFVDNSTDFRLTGYSPSRYISDVGTDIGALPYIDDPTPGLYGTLWDDLTLSGSNNMGGDFTVPQGVTLTLSPGASVIASTSDIMASHLDITKAELRIEGSLVANGTLGEPITFESTSSGLGKWYGIHLLPSSTGTTFTHVEVKEAVTAITHEADELVIYTNLAAHSSSYGMHIKGGSPLIDQSTFYNNSYGLYLSVDGSVIATNSIFRHNTYYGVYGTNSLDSAAIFDYCTFVGNDWGLRWYTSGSGTKTLQVKNSIIANNADYGIYSSGTGASATLASSNYWDNPDDNYGVSYSGSNQSINPLFVDAASDLALTGYSPSRFFSDVNTDIGALPYVDEPTPGLYGTLWEDMTLSGTHDIDGDLTVPPGVTLTLNPGTKLIFATTDIMGGNENISEAEFRIEGTIFALGTKYEVIQIESTGSSINNWAGLHFTPSAEGSLFQYVDIAEATVGILYEAIANNPIEYTTIHDSSTGLHITDGSPLVDGLHVYDSYYGVNIAASGEGTFTNCLIHDNYYYGFYFTNSSAVQTTIANCTIDNNDWGIRVYTSGSGTKSLKLVNSIITNSGDYGVYSSGTGATTHAKYTNFWNNPDGNYGLTEGSGNKSTNPLFVSSSSYALQESSPMVDAGTSTNEPDHDILGIERPQDGDLLHDAEFDLGAYEFERVFPGISASPDQLTTTEGGGYTTVAIVLDSEPEADVYLDISTSDETEGTADPTLLGFNLTNWDVEQYIVLTGVDDDLDDGDKSYQLQIDPTGSVDLVYKVLSTVTVDATNGDDDETGLIFDYEAPLMTSESAGSATILVSLGSEPTSNVRLDIASTDTTEGMVSPPVLTFSNQNWNVAKTVTVLGKDDGQTDGHIDYQIEFDPGLSGDSLYAALDVTYLEAKNLDDETVSPGVTVAGGPLATSESGTSDSFSVVLDTAPTNSVTISLTSGDSGEGHVEPSSLTFDSTNWSQEQAATVTGQDDNVDDGDVEFSIVVGPITSDDQEYAALDPDDVTVSNGDDDTSSVTVVPFNSLQTSEDGGTATFEVSIGAQPSHDVVISLYSDDLGEGTVLPAELTFTHDGFTEVKTVAITGVDDDDVDGDQSFTIVLEPVVSNDPYYNNLNPTDVTVTNLDDDVLADTGDSDLDTDTDTDTHTGWTWDSDTGLYGTCKGNCGGTSDGICFCDAACKTFGDCCSDFDEFCSDYPFDTGDTDTDWWDT